MSNILLIKCNKYLNKKEYTELYESLINQKANGLILLSTGFEAFVVPEDAEIKMETPNTDKPSREEMINALRIYCDGHTKCDECPIQQELDSYNVFDICSFGFDRKSYDQLLKGYEFIKRKEKGEK